MPKYKDIMSEYALFRSMGLDDETAWIAAQQMEGRSSAPYGDEFDTYEPSPWPHKSKQGHRSSRSHEGYDSYSGGGYKSGSAGYTRYERDEEYSKPKYRKPRAEPRYADLDNGNDDYIYEAHGLGGTKSDGYGAGKYDEYDEYDGPKMPKYKPSKYNAFDSFSGGGYKSGPSGYMYTAYEPSHRSPYEPSSRFSKSKGYESYTSGGYKSGSAGYPPYGSSSGGGHKSGSSKHGLDYGSDYGSGYGSGHGSGHKSGSFKHGSGYDSAYDSYSDGPSGASDAYKAYGVKPPVDLYVLLGVARNANVEEIRKAYRKASLQSHPDRARPEDKAKATERQASINAAWDVLNDEIKREMYDDTGLIFPDFNEAGGK
jgi:hypothetical protein